MVCACWDKQNNYCNFKKTTINFEDLNFCAQDCTGYVPSKAINLEELLECKTCGEEFVSKWSRKVNIKGKEYDKCPKCGSINIKRNDEALS